MPKIVDHDAYRAELLERAFTFFAAHGVAAVTMRGLAREIGVSTGTLYHYFADKDAIFEQMGGHVAARSVEDALGGIPEGATPAESVETIVGFVEAAEPRLRSFMLLALDQRRHPGTTGNHDVITRAMASFEAAIRAQVADEGGLVASLVLSAMLGLIARRVLVPESVEYSDHVAVLRRLFVERGES